MLKNLIKLFFPELCAGCTTILLQYENTICTVCRHDLPRTNHVLSVNNEAYKKFYGRVLLSHVSAMFYYHKKGIAQQLIHNLKYNNHQVIGKVIGEWYVNDLAKLEVLKDLDYIIPVPLHKKRLRERGYNQVESFGQALSIGLTTPYNDLILLRQEYAITQSKKNLNNRNTVSNTTFAVQFTAQHHGKHFLLIDDVLTTGATLEACALAILQIPGAKLSIVTMAMSQS